ncbi:MAG: MFS transporter [Anaerolineae bacterium]|nr:MFS transporter [Anaerolineae bacterium]
MNEVNARRVLMAAIWSSFLVFGFQLAGVGPLISVFAGRTGVSIETVGILFTVQSFASLTSAAMIGGLIERYNVRLVILLAMTCVTIGMIGLLASETFALLLVSGAIGGFGLALMDGGGQLLIVSIYGDKSARPLNSLHLLFSVGAVIGPFLASQIGIGMFYVAIAALFVTLPTLFLTLPKNLKVGGGIQSGPRSASLYRSPVLWMFAVIYLLYVGMEIGVGNWTTEYLAGTSTLDRNAAGIVTSMYWLAFMLSRLVVTAAGNRLSFERQLIFSMGLALIGSLVYLLTVGNTVGSVVATLTIGFSFGPIYPAAFAIVTRRFASSAGRAAGVIGAAGSIGAMSIVPIQGVLLERGGGTIMTGFVLILTVGMLASYYFADRGVNAH